MKKENSIIEQYLMGNLCDKDLDGIKFLDGEDERIKQLNKEVNNLLLRHFKAKNHELSVLETFNKIHNKRNKFYKSNSSNSVLHTLKNFRLIAASCLALLGIFSILQSSNKSQKVNFRPKICLLTKSNICSSKIFNNDFKGSLSINRSGKFMDFLDVQFSPLLNSINVDKEVIIPFLKNDSIFLAIKPKTFLVQNKNSANYERRRSIKTLDLYKIALKKKNTSFMANLGSLIQDGSTPKRESNYFTSLWKNKENRERTIPKFLKSLNFRLGIKALTETKFPISTQNNTSKTNHKLDANDESENSNILGKQQNIKPMQKKKITLQSKFIGKKNSIPESSKPVKKDDFWNEDDWVIPESNVHYTQAIIYQALNKNRKASKEYFTAIKESPKNIKIYYNAISFFEGMGNFNASKKVLSALIEQYPNHKDALYRMTIILNKLNKFKKAEKVLTQLTNYEPNNWKYLELRGSHYKMRGKFKKAEKDYTRIVNLNNSDFSKFRNRALFYKTTNQKQKEAMDMVKYYTFIGLKRNFVQSQPATRIIENLN